MWNDESFTLLIGMKTEDVNKMKNRVEIMMLTGVESKT